MKRLILASIAFLITLYFATAKEPAKVKVVQPAKTEKASPKLDSQAIADIFNKLPDSTVFEWGDQKHVIYFKDAEDLTFQIDAIVKDAKEKNPKTPMEWAIWLFGLVAAGRVLPVLVQAKKVGKSVLDFFGKEHQPLNIVIAVSGALAAVATFFWQKPFDTFFFFAAWGWLFSLSEIVYQKIIKPKRAKEVKD